MPYNVAKHIKKGSVLTIRSKKWYDRHKDEFGSVTKVPYHFTSEMAKHCGKKATVTFVGTGNCSGTQPLYRLDVDGGRNSWSVPMFVVPRKHNISNLTPQAEPPKRNPCNP